MKKVMKKTLTLSLIIVLVLSMGLSPYAADNADSQLQPLPQVGQVISGFRVEELGYMDILNAKTILFEHEKTGAQLFYIQNKDIDRSFEIAFRTPAVDNTGVNHILEHISVSGSEKYPLKDVLFTIANQTYSTFVNAFTSATMTAYPVSSMSEDQLLKLADVYLDCVFHPLIYTDKNLFLREAWRYELSDADAPLVINGTVYNEMKGALGNISTAAYYNVLDALFPNSIQANISGGNPENVRDLTYEQLIQTHQNYYHPSNCLMILYGDLDYTRFLEMIDGQYLQSFDKKDMQIDYGKIEPLQDKIEATYKFPVTADTQSKNAAQIDYAFALTDIPEEDTIGLSILAAVLNQNSSPLKQAFAERQIGGHLSVGLNDSIIQPVFTFTAQNADETKKDVLKQLVDESIRDLIENGCDKEMVNAVISATLLSYSNLTEASNLGINLSMSIGVIWANTGNVNSFNDLVKNINSIAEKIDQGYIESLAEKYLLSNQHAALVTTIPEPGLAEQLAEQQQTYLANLKAAMSPEEIEKLVNDTEAYNAWNSKETDPSVVEQLQVVKVADLPVEVKSYEISESKLDDGISMLSAAADVGETGITSLMLNTAAVPAEKLHMLQLYASLLSKLDTENYTKEQLNTLVIRYLNGASFSLSAIPQEDWNRFIPVMSTSWMGLMGEYAEQMDLVKEILLHTKFTDPNTVLTIVRQQISNLKNQITNNPLNLLMSRNLANLNTYNRYQSYLSGLEYYDFLVQIEGLLQSNPDAVLSELQAMHQLVINKTNMITMFAGNEKSIGTYESEVKKLIDLLPAKNIIEQDYSQIPAPSAREGIVLNSSVQYNMISADYERVGTVYSGKYIPIGLFIAENYITPKIRFGYGAYDNIVNFGSNSFMLVSYRDPNIRETYEVYRGLPEFIRSVNTTQEELDRYILQAFSTYTTPAGELSGASSAMGDYLRGKTAQDRLKVLQEIKSTTVADLKESAAMFEELITNGVWSTVGSAEKIEANKDLYDAIVTFGQQTDEPVTRARFFEIILAGVPEPVETAKQVGLLLGDGTGNYYENEMLTREQLAVILNRLAALNGVQLAGDSVAIGDEADISPWAISSVKALVASGVAKLDADGSYHPKAVVTESYVQTILVEFMTALAGM